MKVPPFYDIVGAVVTLFLLFAVIAYPLCGTAIPEEIRTAFAVAMGWVFRGATGIANDYLHRKEAANDA
jgi:ATP/ADP translocase